MMEDLSSVFMGKFEKIFGKTEFFWGLEEGRLGAAWGGGHARVIITRTSRIHARPGAAENFAKMCGEGTSRCIYCIYPLYTLSHPSHPQPSHPNLVGV